MAIGNFGIPVGTEIVVPAAGALAATGHLSNWYLAATVATLGELAGGFLLYLAGFYGGRPFVARWGRLLKMDEKKLDAFHAFYARHGGIVVLVCRFIPFVRGVSALPAGVSRMRKLDFILYTLVGSAIFCFGLAWLGYSFGSHINEIIPQIHRFSTLAIVVLALAFVAWLAYRLVRGRSAARRT